MDQPKGAVPARHLKQVGHNVGETKEFSTRRGHPKVHIVRSADGPINHHRKPAADLLVHPLSGQYLLCVNLAECLTHSFRLHSVPPDSNHSLGTHRYSSSFI